MANEPFDPRRALSAHRAQERAAWDRYAAAALVESMSSERDAEDAAITAAMTADLLLEKRRERFPGPKFIRAEDTE